MPVKIADHPGIAPGGALPHHLLAEGRRVSPAVKAGVVDEHHAAPDRDGQIGPEQVRTAPYPVGHMGQREAKALRRHHLGGRYGQKQVGF